MSHFKGAALLLLTIALSACSSIRVTPVSIASGPVKKAQAYILEVQTGNVELDKFLYEQCYREFSAVLPIVEKGVYTGVIEVAFLSTTDGASIGGNSTASSANVQGFYSRYSGVGYTSASLATNSVSSGQMLKWQNSSMDVVIKRKEGDRIWSGDYQYKGGWEMSGWSVNTADEAARLCAQRMARYMKTAFSNVE